jgi:hypothetical protein
VPSKGCAPRGVGDGVRIPRLTLAAHRRLNLSMETPVKDSAKPRKKSVHSKRKSTVTAESKTGSIPPFYGEKFQVCLMPGAKLPPWAF